MGNTMGTIWDAKVPRTYGLNCIKCLTLFWRYKYIVSACEWIGVMLLRDLFLELWTRHRSSGRLPALP